jgi:hypothetical protein
MPHIALPDSLPGITSAFAFRPETARPMGQLSDQMGQRMAREGYVRANG